MQRLIPALAAPLLVLATLAGCASASSGSSDSASPNAAAPATTGASPSTASAAGGGSTGGAITFTGAYSGTMTIDQCTDDVTALTIHFTGSSTVSSGGIDKLLDFGFNGPNGEQFIPTSRDEKPKKSGKTYTVTNTKLAAGSKVVTANGSVTCP